MSIRFKNFITRIGKQCDFNPLKNALPNYLKKDAKNKYKNFPRLIELMKDYWPEYKNRSRISHLLKDHHEEIFYFYLNKIFPFRKGGLKFEEPEAPTPVDFKLVYKYHYNQREIEVIKNVMKDLNIQESIEKILKRLLIFAVFSFGPMVEKVFERPFEFQFSSIDANQLKNGEWEIVAVISAREQ
ncbi:MAG: hypothetical protein ACFFAN_08395 [Promethearchaeota archaeon]